MTLLLFSVLLLVIAVAGRFIFGEIGVSICACLLGAFGYFLYPVLISAVVWSLALIAGKKIVSAKWYFRTLAVLASVFLIAHLATSTQYLGAGYASYLSGCWGAASDGVSATAGGVLFGLVVYPFAALLSSVGAYILFAALTALSVFFFLRATALRAVVRGFATRPKAEKAPRGKVEPTGVRRYPQEDAFDALDEPLVPQGNGASGDQPYNRYYDDPQDEHRMQYRRAEGQPSVPEPQQIPRPSYRAAEQSRGREEGYTSPQNGYTPPQNGYTPPQNGYTPPQNGYTPQPQNKEPLSGRDILFGDPITSYQRNLIYRDDSAFNSQQRHSSISPTTPRREDNTPKTYVTRGSSAPASPRKDDNTPRTIVTRGGVTTPSSPRREDPPAVRRSSISPTTPRGEDNIPKTIVTRGGSAAPAALSWRSEPPAPRANYSEMYADNTRSREHTPPPRKIVEQHSERRDLSDALNYPDVPSFRMSGSAEQDLREHFDDEEEFSSQPNVNDDVPRDSFGQDGGLREEDLPYWQDPTLKRSEGKRTSGRSASRREDLREFNRERRDPTQDTSARISDGRSVPGKDFDDRTTLRVPEEESALRNDFDDRTTLRVPEEESALRNDFDDRTTLRVPEEENTLRNDFDDRTTLRVPEEQNTLRNDFDDTALRVPEEPSPEREDPLHTSIGFGEPAAPVREEPLAESRVRQAMASHADDLDGDDVEEDPHFLPAKEERPVQRRVPRPYVRPDPDDLSDYQNISGVTDREIDQNSQIIVDTLSGFRVDAVVKRVTVGATVTRYDIDVPGNVAVSQVIKRDEEIGMRLHTRDGVNIYANSEKGLISIEVPNSTRSTVGLRSVMQAEEYQRSKPGALMFAIGQDVEGRNVCGDIAKMTHILVAGATNSGKSVCLNSMLVSLICKYSPEELRLILIDPKKIEFAPYEGLPHLMINEIINDTQKAIKSLNWAIKEMERRYTLFEQKTRAGTAVRNTDEYNSNLFDGEERLAKIVIVVDELADLMSVAKKDIEERIQRLTQKARAAGIHLVIATQRPSVDVITGVIKGNLPTRMAFRVIQEVDSRTILDESGAQKLLGNGDMLFRTGGMFSSMRVQGAFISSQELQRVVADIKSHNEAFFDSEMENFINQSEDKSADGEDNEGVSEEYIRALSYSVQAGTTSTSSLQRRFSIGYNHAARIIDWMEMMGYILPYEGNPRGGRKVVLTPEEFESKYGSTKE